MGSRLCFGSRAVGVVARVVGVGRRLGRSGRLSLAVLVVATALAATLIAVSPAGVEGQEGSDAGDVQVRIVARRVVGERVEFGLQQREADGDWGARLLPRQRFFPLGTSEGRWLVSTPLSLSDTALEARIVARRVANGRVEFGLQQREPSRSWGQRLLPQSRLFPVNTTVGRWLVSSPLALAVGATEVPPPMIDDIDAPPEEQPSDPPPEPTPPTTQPPVDPVEELASLVLDGTNSARGALGPLSWHEGLSAAAQARAEAQAESDDWQQDFDYDALLAAEWGVWFIDRSTSIASDLDDRRVVQTLGEALLDADSRRAVLCELCTHLGIGVATRRGKTYVTTVVAGPAPTTREIAALEAQMADLVNELRESLGLQAFAYNSGVAAVARNWSQTMASTEEFEHNPNFREQYPPGSESGSENIANVPVLSSLTDAVRWAFNNLVDSPLHYQNMIHPTLNQLGVGIAVRGGVLWVTQNFARYPAGVQQTQAGPPGPTTVTATGGVNRLSARWSAEANGAAITHWEFQGRELQTFDGAATSYTWPLVDAGRYTIQLRACNARGCGAWGSATVTVTDPASETPEPPTTETTTTRRVEVSRGANAQNVHPNCTSANCHYVRVTLVNFEPGTYTVSCRHDGVAGYPAGQYGWYTTSATTSEYCIWGFAGHDTYVIVEDPQTSEPIRSNDAQWP